MGGRTAKSSLVQMEQHLQNAGVLIFFPAGEVSRPTRKGIRDKKWHSGFIKLASKLRAPLLPVHIQAHNSLLFMPARWSRRRCPAAADAADVPPPP
jgi:putative hemolysin